MISEAFINFALGIATWAVGLIPDWELPAELLDADGMISDLFAFGAGLGPWVDWGFVLGLAAIPLGVWVIGLTWKAIRTILSHFPQFGGSG